MATKTQQQHSVGKVVQVIGPVLDVEFEPEQLPELYNAVTVQLDSGQLVAEVEQHIGRNQVRGVGERTREGNDLYLEFREAGILENVALIYGQMNEPPGARLRVGLTGLTVAEYFRDVEGQDVLVFIDNIFRFTQAGSEVSALLGRMPSAVGYQPTLATEMGELQERITSTKKGSITSV